MPTIDPKAPARDPAANLRMKGESLFTPREGGRDEVRKGREREERVSERETEREVVEVFLRDSHLAMLHRKVYYINIRPKLVLLSTLIHNIYLADA